MDLLLIKLTLTPLLMAAVSMASRRWGGTVGGLLAGLPLTAGPISIYLTIEQGRTFTALVALSAIGGIGAVTLSYLVYMETSRRSSILVSIAATVLAFVAASLVLRVLDLPLGLVLTLDCLLIALVFLRTPSLASTPSQMIHTAWDLPARIMTSTSMVLVITFCAHIIGPRYSGLLSTVPMIGWPLIAFAHKQQGRAEALAVTLGIVRGCPGLIAFYLVLFVMFPQHAPLVTFPAALGLSLALTAGWLWQRRLTARSVLR